MNRLFSLLLYVAFFANANASDLEKPPTHIFGLYGKRIPICDNAVGPCSKKSPSYEGETANYVLVTPGANNNIGVEIDLFFAAGHTCRLSETGEWKKDHISLWSEDRESYELKLYFEKGNLRLIDDGNKFSDTSHSCGARGYYDGTVLPKKGSI